MIRLQEFITKIRNCKTIAEERAQYQKEMAAIRESFAKNQQNLRPRNVTKLLFINMSGQETNFGQMECLKLITANSLIEKRIGYLGLTQLFHQKSQLLMMATNRIRVDLTSNNSNIVGLTLCVLSQICTSELSKQLHNEVLKCISNGNSYIRKKAILTGIKIIKKSPQYISQFLSKVSVCLEEKNHGVLLSCMAMLQNILHTDESMVGQLVALVPKIARIYKMVSNESNSDYEIGGVQDPFLQVAILRFLRYLRKYSDKFEKDFTEILILSHDNVCSRVSGNLKNGANAVLFQCFQCFMLLQPTQHSRQLVSNVLTKFISVKDSNSKYLSVFNLGLMAKYDINIAKGYKTTIIECLSENDILIRVMALDLLYIIASADNVSAIIKQLLNTLLTATDEQFISELALKICLIVEKHSQSRRWHFDTILKVLILADQSVKQESAKSLIHLITSTPQLQNYSMAKLFFSTSENPQNDTLCRITLYLMGELADILPRIKEVQIAQANVLDLIENLIFRVGAKTDTIAYGLSSLLKLYEKFNDKARILKMISSFQSHSDLEVQKRACEYAKLSDPSWDYDRKKEICIPIPVFKVAADAFRSIPVGDTNMEIDIESMKMPEKLDINYSQLVSSKKDLSNDQPIEKKPIKIEPIKNIILEQSKPQKQQVSSILDDDIFGTNSTPVITNPVNKNPPPNFNNDPLGGFSFEPPISTNPVVKPINNNDDPFNLLGLDVINTNTQPTQNLLNQNFGFGAPTNTVTKPPVPVNAGFDFLGGFSQPSPVVQQTQPNNMMGDFLGFGASQPSVQPTTNNNLFKAYENNEMQIWMQCIKEGVDTAKITASYHNKTQSVIENIALQVAVMKHLKLVINPLNSTTMQPNSKGVVQQTMSVVNSAVGQKNIVMKIKLNYLINGQKMQYQQKIDKLPNGL